MEEDLPDSRSRLDPNTYSAIQRRVRDYYARLPQARQMKEGLSLLPWHLLPSVDQFRRDPRMPNDFRDGRFIEPAMITEAEAALAAFVKLKITSKEVGIRRLDRMGAICLILQTMNARHLLGKFLEQRIVDASLPLSEVDLITILRDGDATLDFLGEQYRAKQRPFTPEAHIEYEECEPMPYSVQRNIGTGGHGKVDEVRDIRTGKVHAMKSWKNAERNAKSRLLEEASVLKELANHKHVVQLINTFSRGKLLGLVMHPVAICDLNDLIEARPRDRAWAIPTLKQAPGCLSAALADIHSLKIRHKDISPKNVLICQGHVLLTDFGLSIDVSEMSRTDTSGPTSRTFNYCSPEVALQESRGRKSDVFSLGCVILVVLGILSQDETYWQGEILAFRPFHINVEKMGRWIQERVSTSKSPMISVWLRNCHRMTREAADSRPAMIEVLEDVLSDLSLGDSLISTFCNDCLVAKNTPGMTNLRSRRMVSFQSPNSDKAHSVNSTAVISAVHRRMHGRRVVSRNDTNTDYVLSSDDRCRGDRSYKLQSACVWKVVVYSEMRGWPDKVQPLANETHDF